MSIDVEVGEKKHRPYLGIDSTPNRKPKRHNLTGELVISADNHIGLGGEDFFYVNAPARLKDRVPRILWAENKKMWDMLMHGKTMWPLGGTDLAFSMEGRVGAWNVDEHVADMEAEGVQKTVAFPNLIPSMFKLGDYEAREFIMFQYNKYLARLQRRQPGRFFGVGIPNYWDPKTASSWIKEMKDDGLRVVMLPLSPGNYPNGEGIFYADEKFDAMWQAIAENDMATVFHIGENFNLPGKGGFEGAGLSAVGGVDFRQTWGRLTFGGVFDRFPTLRVDFAEGGLNWIPGMLQDADMLPESLGTTIWKCRPKHRPSDYWYSNCVASFMYDPAGLRLIDLVGVDNAMWSVDYPHNEGTYGYTGDAIQSIVELTGADKARKIYGGNAQRFLGL